MIYNVQFANQDFKTAGHTMRIIDKLAVFDGLSVDLALAAVNALPSELISPAIPLSYHLNISEVGSMLSRDLRGGKDLRLDCVFRRTSVTDIPD